MSVTRLEEALDQTTRLKLQVELDVTYRALLEMHADLGTEVGLSRALRWAVDNQTVAKVRDLAPPRKNGHQLTLPDGETVIVKKGKGRYPDRLAAICGTGKPWVLRWDGDAPRLEKNPDYKGDL